MSTFFVSSLVLLLGAPVSGMRATTQVTWPPEPKDIWALLSIERMSCSVCESDAQLSLMVTLYPSGVEYEMPASSAASSLELHVYVPRTDIFADVSLYNGYQSSTLGTLTLSLFNDFVQFPKDALLGDAGWCQMNIATSEGCSFTRDILGAANAKSPGSLTGTLYTGEAMFPVASALNQRGVKPMYTDKHDRAADYKLARVPVDNIENYLNYAKTGSPIPDSLQGLIWMDQRGVHLHDEGSHDDDYAQECETASDEILVSFGEAGWNADTRCIEGEDIYGGGPLWGHWTWFDQTGGGSEHWDGAGIHKPIARFCLTEDNQTIDIYRSFMAANLPGMNGLHGVDFGMDFPASFLHLKMNRKSWGWDRETLVAGGMKVCHYPVWQIVDGHGQRTKHYDRYVEWATNQSSCPDEKSTFLCHQNVAKDRTQMIARALPDLCGYAVVGAKKRGGQYTDGITCKCERGQELTGGSEQCSGSRKFDPAALSEKGCRCSLGYGIDEAATPLPVASICAHAVVGAVASGDSANPCSCPPSSSVEAAYGWSDEAVCSGAGHAFAPEGMEGKGCRCGMPARCCCKGPGPETCELLRADQLKSSWDVAKWGQPVCPSGYHHVGKFNFESRPESCVEAQRPSRVIRGLQKHSAFDIESRPE